KIYEARELQIALGLVAAGEGVSVVPRSVAGLRREDVCYMELDDPQLVSPIIFSTRLLDEYEDIQAMLALTYRLYDEQNIPYYAPS
ncbi:LysR family transcriptional regulator, partial [Leclercia adecarboxylata]|nr:LysR family transcriptional regulator [Leclercia adecarboxylata]